MRIGIYGYGNLGKACEEAISLNPDMKLIAVFTRRDPKSIALKTKNALVLSSYDVMNYINRIDVMINCGGSSTDLPNTTAFLARHFNVVDSYDNHENINEHFRSVDTAARENGNVALISAGWEPGLFSVMRLFFSAFLPSTKPLTFWGKGISQGHCEVIKHIHGVKDALEYTLPDEEIIEKARNENIDFLNSRQTHKRVCYVSLDEVAYKDDIEEQIKNLPGYFLGYDTEVIFTSQNEIDLRRSNLYHMGRIISKGKTASDGENSALMEMDLKLDCGPEFTAGVLMAYARAVHVASKRGEKGCRTVVDIPPADLLPLNEYEIRSTLI